MITYKDFILNKGKSYTIHIPFDVTGMTGFNAELYTTGELKVIPSDIQFDSGNVCLTFNPEALDDGVLRYTFTWYVGGLKQVKATNTPYVINTPEGYSAQTADEIYVSGETAGAEAQKALMVGATIVENGEYVRPDGYSAVTVNVSGGTAVDTTSMTVSQSVETIESEPGKSWSAVTVDATQYGSDKYNSGYTDGIDYQKSLLSSSAFTEDGTYTYPNGLSAITVNVNGESPYLISESADTGVYVDFFQGSGYHSNTKLELGVVFKQIGDDAFLSFGSFNLYANSNGISAEHYYDVGSYDDFTIYNNPTTGTLYTFEIYTSPTNYVFVNGDSFENVRYLVTPYGNIILNKDGGDNIFEIRYLNYYNESGVTRLNLTQIPGGLQTQLVQPKLIGKKQVISNPGTYTFEPNQSSDGEKSIYGLSAVTVNVNYPKAGWKTYQNGQYTIVKENCSNDGDYLCHVNENNTFTGVEISGGAIVARNYGGLDYDLGDGRYTGSKEHNGVYYTFNCWVQLEDNVPYLYWITSHKISMLDGYGTGTDKQGWPGPF